jgi:endonuclease/exonuclease/phosphatase family metal-dependent hydrolase
MLSIVTLNCQKAFQPAFKPYMEEILSQRRYDFLLLQEVDLKTLETIQPIFKENRYTRLSAFSPKTNSELYTCILYKNEFEFLRSDFITFTPIVIQEVTETGSIAGVFKIPLRYRRGLKKKKILLIATHLHASYHLLARKKELRQVKNQALHLDPKDECIKVIAGDFNNLIKGESKIHDAQMKPEFTNISDFDTPTYDSKYIEPKYSEALYARLFFSGGKRYQMKLDHIFVDSQSAKRLLHDCKVIDVVASDHKPIELNISPKKRKLVRRN